MSKITKQNVGGVDYTMVGCTLTGACNSAASDYVKSVTLSDGDVLSDGMTVVVAFTNGNTAGTAPASMTIYSSDQENYFTDSELTQPFTLAPLGCYEIEYTGTGNAYTYISYPVLQVGSVSGPLCDASGNKASGALWLAGDKVSINYANGCFSVIPQTTGAMTVIASSATVNGAPIRVGSTVRVLFTQDIAGTDTSTGFAITYNGVEIPVMAGKNGSLAAFTASNMGDSTYKYLQAYTTLEMAYDGTQFIILGNPVVISSADYTIYTDGSTKYTTVGVNSRYHDTETVAVSTGLGTFEGEAYIDNGFLVIRGRLYLETNAQAYNTNYYIRTYVASKECFVGGSILYSQSYGNLTNLLFRTAQSSGTAIPVYYIGKVS